MLLQYAEKVCMAESLTWVVIQCCREITTAISMCEPCSNFKLSQRTTDNTIVEFHVTNVNLMTGLNSVPDPLGYADAWGAGLESIILSGSSRSAPARAASIRTVHIRTLGSLSMYSIMSWADENRAEESPFILVS